MIRIVDSSGQEYMAPTWEGVVRLMKLDSRSINNGEDIYMKRVAYRFQLLTGRALFYDSPEGLLRGLAKEGIVKILAEPMG
jgi:hypothetical protein